MYVFINASLVWYFISYGIYLLKLQIITLYYQRIKALIEIGVLEDFKDGQNVRVQFKRSNQ